MKKIRILALLAALPCAAALAPGAPLQTPSAPPSDAQAADQAPTRMLRLRSGAILWGSIAGHGAEQLEFLRLDNGGLVKLPWSHLDPDEEAELRLRFGYVDQSAEELMTKADKITLKDGTEIIGLIQSRSEDYIFVKQGGNTKPVRKEAVAGPSTIVEVPALDVYTKEDLYQAKVFELQASLVFDGEPGAQAHFEVAEYAERLFDYPHAVEHYRIASRLAPEWRKDAVQIALARSEKKAALQEQVDMLAEIDLWRARKRYDRALELLRAFPELYPGSPLTEDWNELRLRVDRYQLRDLREQVVRSWHKWTARLASTAAREKETFDAVLAYVDEVMADDVVKAVQADLAQIAPEIQEDEVRRLWDEREGGKYRQASYGLGTWLLGEERARAVPAEEEEAAEEPATTQSDERKKLEEKIKRYLKNQELTKQAKGGDDEDADPETYWKSWNSSGRRQWILAYFVESSGDFQVARIRFANCRECGGTGGREVIFTGGAISGQQSASRIVPCPTCHTVGVVRRVRYR